MVNFISTLLEYAIKEENNVSFMTLGILFTLLYIFTISINKLLKQKVLNNTSSITKSKLANISAKQITDQYLIYLNKLANKGLKDEDLDFNYKNATALLNPDCNIEYPVITVIYATQSNTAKSFAEIIKKESKITKLKIQVKNISEVDIVDFNSNLLLVFLIATYGEGEPTDDALEFYQKLSSKSLDLTSVDNKFLNYCVFGLGSKKYEKFNQMGKTLDSIFEKDGLKRLIPLQCGDDSDNIRKDFEQWKNELYKSIFSSFFTESNLNTFSSFIKKHSLDKVIENENEYEIKISESLNFSGDGFSINDKDYEYSIRNFLNSKLCSVNTINEMRQSSKNGSTLKINYQINDTELSYQHGDNIGVYPSNNESDVDYVIKRLRFEPENYIHVIKTKQNLSKKITIPSGITVRNSISHLTDLNGKITYVN